MTRKARAPKPIIEPRLKGMLVRPAEGDTESACTLYSWERVGRTLRDHGVSQWTVYDEAGHPVRAGRRRPLTLTLRKEYLGEAALRAQYRAYRQAWRRGDLRIVEHYRFPLGEIFAMLIGLALAAVGVALFVLALVVFLRPSPVFDDEPFLRMAFWMVPALGGCLFSLLGYAFGWTTLRVLRHSRVRTSLIDSEGIRVCGRDGTEQHGVWAELREIRWLNGPLLGLRFESGTEIQLARPGPRTVAAVQVIADILLPDSRRQLQREFRNSLVRCAVYAVLAAILVAVLMRVLIPDETTWPAGLSLALLPGLFYLHWRFLKFDKARLRRKYRRQRRRSQGTGSAS